MATQGNDGKNITPGQVRAARALLGLTAAELAALAGVGVATVGRFELRSDADAGGARDATQAALRKALEKAGVEFIAENGGGAGVRRRKPLRRTRRAAPK
jgi:transcriptional regulator with XRE-family HTH domain